jgi:hypothetical protein
VLLSYNSYYIAASRSKHAEYWYSLRKLCVSQDAS